MDEERLVISYDRASYELFHSIYGPVGFAINLLGILAILIKSTPEMGPYKWYLLNYQIWGTLIDAHYSVSQSEILFPIPGGRTERRPGYNYFWRFGHHANMVLSFSLTASSGAALATCSIYRYNVLLTTLGKGLTTLQLIVIALILHVFFSGSVGLFFLSCWVPYEDATAFFKQEYPYLADILEGGEIDAYFPALNPMLFPFLVYAVFVVLFLGAIYTIFYFKTIQKLNALRHMMTENVYRMNRSLTIALAMQALVPYTLLIVPLFGILTILLAKINHSTGIGMTFLAILSTHASGNTVVLLLMVKPYRHMLYSWIFDVLGYSEKVSNFVRRRIGIKESNTWTAKPTITLSASGLTSGRRSTVVLEY